MFIYILTSPLFEGQDRKIITSFPIEIPLLEDMVNSDNTYPKHDHRRWRVISIR